MSDTRAFWGLGVTALTLALFLMGSLNALAQIQLSCQQQKSDRIYTCNQDSLKCKFECDYDSDCQVACTASFEACLNEASATFDVCYTNSQARELQPVEEKLTEEKPPAPSVSQDAVKEDVSEADTGPAASPIAVGNAVFINGMSDQAAMAATGQTIGELLGRPMSILQAATLAIPEASTDLNDFTFRVDLLSNGTSTAGPAAQVRLPGSQEWVDLQQGTRLPVGTEIFTGADTTTVLAIPGVGVVEVLPLTNLVLNRSGFSEGVDQGVLIHDLELRTGEIEVDIEGGDYQPSFQIQTPNVVAGVRGTHFWMKHDDERGYSLVGVYEGIVEVEDVATGEVSVVTPAADGGPQVLFVPVAPADQDQAAGAVEPGQVWPWLASLGAVIVLAGLGALAYWRRDSIGRYWSVRQRPEGNEQSSSPKEDTKHWPDGTKS